MNMQIRKRERGAVLIVALIFLVILTMLGVTAMTGTTMELRMSGNTRDVAVALHAAESALRDAENDIQGLTYAGKTGEARASKPLPVDYGVAGAAGTCNNTAATMGLCMPVSDPVDNQPLPADLIGRSGISFTAAPSVPYGEYTGAIPLTGVAVQPRYLIELLPFLSPRPGMGSIKSTPGARVEYYRITARGYGGNPNSIVTVSEVFTMPTE